MTYYRRKARTGLEGMVFDVRHAVVPATEANDVEPFAWDGALPMPFCPEPGCGLLLRERHDIDALDCACGSIFAPADREGVDRIDLGDKVIEFEDVEPRPEP